MAPPSTPPPAGRPARRGAAPSARRRRRVGLTADGIAAAALALVDREGLAALTARSLARDLGCEAMSLYHHVAGMEGILDAVADRLLAAVEVPAPESASDPSALLRTVAERYLATAAAHPRAFPLLAGRRLRTAAALALVGRLLAALAACGVDADEGLRRVRVLVAYLNGAGLALAAWRLEPLPTPSLAAADAALPPVSPARLQVEAVRADLLTGVDLLLAGLGEAPAG